MTVTGTQQRVYGTLTASNSCLIDLHRFALVSGSTTLSPPEASTVTYADTTPYKQCGYKYSGYITLFLSISGSSVYAAVEVRICKNDPKRIVIETYGEVAKTVTGGMSLWFNKGNDTTPDWVKLNSTTSGVKMPYATTSYTFKESKRNGSTTIDCCKKCPSCGCKTCDILSRVLSRYSPNWVGTFHEEYTNPSSPYESWLKSSNISYSVLNYGIYNRGDQTIVIYDGGCPTWSSCEEPQLYVEYKLLCNTIEIWAGNLVQLNYYDFLFYLDDDNNWHKLTEGGGNYFTIGRIPMLEYYGTFPFDYLKNCTSYVCTLCGKYAIVPLSTSNIPCQTNMINKSITITGASTWSAIIENVVIQNLNMYLKCKDISTTDTRSGSLVQYDESNYGTDSRYYPGGLNQNVRSNANAIIGQIPTLENVKIEFDYVCSLSLNGYTFTSADFINEQIAIKIMGSGHSTGYSCTAINAIYITGNSSGHIGPITIPYLGIYYSIYGSGNDNIHYGKLSIELFLLTKIWSIPTNSYSEGIIEISNVKIYDCCNKLVNIDDTVFCSFSSDTFNISIT